MTTRTIDLNADCGEGAGEAQLYAIVSSANVACGGHAGDASTMREAVRLALAHRVAVGAHPSYPDRAGFGRVSMALAPGALAEAVARQVDALAAVARELGATLTHVKPHGALYNDAARDRTVAAAVAEGVGRVSGDLVLVGLSGSAALDLWRARGFCVAAEGFADRAYESDGSLAPRSRAGSVLSDPDAAAAQAVRLARERRCETICVHADTPRAAEIAAAVREALAEAGWTVAALAEGTSRS